MPFAYSSFALAIENAKINDLRVIAEFSAMASKTLIDRVHGAQRSPIKKIADLKGKVVTSNGDGSAVDIAMREMMKSTACRARRITR